ncbi:hypothetical protein CHS0354_031986 [Potamilus streckersoni]|uniref:Peptidase M12B domain-containing protein n=1 Tax=Potamilus streckersoni TaxID=2493646 RepID=A0AAE0WHK0_9BIVA|nr:hypothetical protein CHS0354_031986 [Potamilus streckersoni]
MEVIYYVQFMIHLHRSVYFLLGIVLIYLMCFYIEPVSTLSFPRLDAFDAVHREAIQVELSEHNSPGTKEKRSSEFFPETIKLQLKSKRFSPTILLEKKEDSRSLLPIRYHSNDTYVNESNDGNESYQIYLGKDYAATALLTRENGQLHVMMEFFIDGSQFFVVTQYDPSSSKEITHTLLEPRTLPALGNDYSSEDQAAISGKEHERLKRDTSSGTAMNTIELLIFIDYSLFSFWNEQVSANVSNRERQLIKTIEQYYEFMGTAVDQRYQNIIETDLDIRVKVVGIIIADSEDKSPWTEQYKETATSGKRAIIDATVALPAFANYIKTNRSSLIGHDHAVLITAYDLQRNGSLAAAGFAFLSTLCGDRSVSIVEDHFDFVSLTVMAHEIGHSLGATHDGTGNNNCTGTDGYIMSNINSPTTGLMAYNPWIFSACSRAEFRNYLQNLDMKENCLKRIDASKATNYTYVLPGIQYTADEQCIIMRNEKDSYMCRSLYESFDYSTICTGMFCRKSGFLQCEISLPADGTPCASKKWCINGRCVQSESVPLTCIHGDQMNVVLGYGKVCSALVAQSPWLCYQSSVWEVCCGSCQSVYTGVKGCEYGDKNDCQFIKKNPFGCYNNVTASSACCRTCEVLKKPNSPVGCEYGDKVNNCYNITSVNISLCDDSEVKSACCETCYTGKVCPAGSYLPSPFSDCILCSAGTYQPRTGQNACLPCPVGSYQTKPGSTSCILCDPGTYQPQNGSSSMCLLCKSGMYQTVSGQAKCDSCPVGYYQSKEGSKTCVNCSAGSYQPSTGAVSCIQCEVGFYQNLQGKGFCNKCDGGKITDTKGSTSVSKCYTVVRFVGTLKINRDYKVTYQDKTSADFKNLEEELTNELNSACNNGSLRNFCKYSKLQNTSSGSILAVTEIGYQSDDMVTNNSVTFSLTKALSQSTTSIAQAINKSSIAFSQLTETTTVAPTTKLPTTKAATTQISKPSPQSTLGPGNQGIGASKNESLPDWVIPVAAGAGGALVLGIMIAICCCCCRRQKQRPEHTLHNNAYVSILTTYK